MKTSYYLKDEFKILKWPLFKFLSISPMIFTHDFLSMCFNRNIMIQN